MFVWNLKFNIKLFLKIVFFIIFLVLIAIFIFSGKKIFDNREHIVKDGLNLPSVANVDTSNFTNVLKSVYENLEQYIGQKIRVTGYIYRVSDIKDNEFIVARNMPIDDKDQFVVVRFFM